MFFLSSRIDISTRIIKSLYIMCNIVVCPIIKSNKGFLFLSHCQHGHIGSILFYVRPVSRYFLIYFLYPICQMPFKFFKPLFRLSFLVIFFIAKKKLGGLYYFTLKPLKYHPSILINALNIAP